MLLVYIHVYMYNTFLELRVHNILLLLFCRLCPTALVSRALEEDHVFSGFHVPAGVGSNVPVYGTIAPSVYTCPMTLYL